VLDVNAADSVVLMIWTSCWDC